MSTPATWRRLIRFRSADGRELLGEPVDADVDVGLAMYEGKTVEAREIKGGLFDGRVTEQVHKVKELLSPVSRADLGTIFCIGLNYRDHAQEAKLRVPSIPIVFIKPPAALAGPHPQKVVIPTCCTQGDMAEQCDYEGELCVVISKTGKNIPKEQAYDYVLGYTSSNDVSQRKWQFKESQWTHSKAFDTSAPIGPCLVSPEALPDPGNLSLVTTLNGIKRQDGNTKTLIFDVAEIISFISQGITLEKGSIILTGTPPGVGTFYKPQVFIKDGDDCRVCIGGGIGTLINEFENEK